MDANDGEANPAAEMSGVWGRIETTDGVAVPQERSGHRVDGEEVPKLRNEEEAGATEITGDRLEKK